jgi:hypothetical protein
MGPAGLDISSKQLYRMHASYAVLHAIYFFVKLHTAPAAY